MSEYSRKKHTIVLVEPSKRENIGNIARLAMNFGITDILIVNSGVDLADADNVAYMKIMARKAGTLIDNLQQYASLQAVREIYDVMIGTTARIGGDHNLRRVAQPPEELMLPDFDYSTLAVVFGREQHGLSNEEIGLCDSVITIPTSEDYPVLNLSHAAAIVLYFLYQKIKPEITPKHRMATYQERYHVVQYFERVIESIGYHPEKHHIAVQAFSSVLSRGYVTGRELTTLMGVFKWIDINLNRPQKSRDV